MAPIGPGFTVGAIFAFENNTPVRGCDGGAGGSTLCARPRVEERM
jgi:hypothetical protein